MARHDLKTAAVLSRKHLTVSKATISYQLLMSTFCYEVIGGRSLQNCGILDHGIDCQYSCP